MKNLFYSDGNHVRASLVCLSLGVGIIIFLLATSGCKTGIPPMNVKFWAGDSMNGGITRSQDKKTIECKDPAFDEYIALSYDDLKLIYNTMLQCKSWGSEMTMSELQKFAKQNPEVVHHVLQERSHTPVSIVQLSY